MHFNVGLGLDCFYIVISLGQVMNLNVLMGNLRLMFQLMLFHFGELMPLFVNYIWILLMCALRAHIKSFIFGNILIEKTTFSTIFSIIEKMFPKINGLMCALKAHISKIHI